MKQQLLLCALLLTISTSAFAGNRGVTMRRFIGNDRVTIDQFTDERLQSREYQENARALRNKLTRLFQQEGDSMTDNDVLLSITDYSSRRDREKKIKRDRINA